jgi:hypothetical protein
MYSRLTRFHRYLAPSVAATVLDADSVVSKDFITKKDALFDTPCIVGTRRLVNGS